MSFTERRMGQKPPLEDTTMTSTFPPPGGGIGEEKQVPNPRSDGWEWGAPKSLSEQEVTETPLHSPHSHRGVGGNGAGMEVDIGEEALKAYELRSYLGDADADMRHIARRNAELSVIVSVLLGYESLQKVKEFLKPSHFLNPGFAHLYQVFLAMDRAGTPIDYVTTIEALQHTTEPTCGMAEVFFTDWFITLFEQFPQSPQNALIHAGYVVGYSALRWVRQACDDLVDDIHRNIDTPLEIVETAIVKLERARDVLKTL